MRTLSLTSLALMALALAACGDETPTSPDEASLKAAAVSPDKAGSAPADSLSLKSAAVTAPPSFVVGKRGGLKESSVCAVRKRELALVRSKLAKGATPALKTDEVNLNAIVDDVCN